MNLVITMDFITRCCRREWPEQALRALCLGWMVLFGVPAQADTATDILQYQVERVDDEVLLSAQIAFELPSAVEEALLKGIPMFFVTEAEVGEGRRVHGRRAGMCHRMADHGKSLHGQVVGEEPFSSSACW